MSDGTANSNTRLSSNISGQTVSLHRDPAKFGRQRADADDVLDHYQQLLDLAAPNVGLDSLHWLGHFVNGDATFSLDVLENENLDGLFHDPQFDPDQLRDALVKLGRRLNYDLSRIDKDMRVLRTGRLIRIVFDVATVGVFWYWIHEREYLVGLTLAGDQVDEADRDMAEVAENILKLLRKAPRNYGGFQRGLVRRRDVGPKVPARNVRLKQSLRPPDDVEELERRCQAALDPRDLHYVSMFVEGSWALSADVFDANPTTRSYGGVPADLRRSYYEQFGTAVQYDVAEFDRLLRTVTRHRPGKLVRTVFDVESGAIYHHPLDIYRYLIGVTVFQDQVEYAEDRFRTLAEDLGTAADGSRQTGNA